MLMLDVSGQNFNEGFNFCMEVIEFCEILLENLTMRQLWKNFLCERNAAISRFPHSSLAVNYDSVPKNTHLQFISFERISFLFVNLIVENFIFFLSSLIKSLPLNLLNLCLRGSKAPKVGKIQTPETLSLLIKQLKHRVRYFSLNNKWSVSHTPL